MYDVYNYTSMLCKSNSTKANWNVAIVQQLLLWIDLGKFPIG